MLTSSLGQTNSSKWKDKIKTNFFHYLALFSAVIWIFRGFPFRRPFLFLGNVTTHLHQKTKDCRQTSCLCHRNLQCLLINLCWVSRLKTVSQSERLESLIKKYFTLASLFSWSCKQNCQKKSWSWHFFLHYKCFFYLQKQYIFSDIL